MSNHARAVSVAAALAASLAVILLVWHAWHYFFLYDDFSLVATAGGTSGWTLATRPTIGFFRPLPFLVLRAQFGLVQWTPASAYAFAALLIHFINAALIGVLARKIGLRKQLAFTAVALFLLSAAAGEGYFWLSSTFDRFCVLGALLPLVAGLSVVSATNLRALGGWAFVGVLGTVVALLSKESGVVLPALSLAAFAMAGIPIRARAVSYVALQSALVIPLLFYRQRILPDLNGAYGTLGALYDQADVPANLISYATSIAHVPLPWHDATWLIGRLAGAAVFLSAASWVVVLVVLGLRRPIIFASGFAAALAAIAPVAWVPILPGTTASGRFLYLPGIVAALLPALALDFDDSTRLRVVRSVTSVAVIVILGVQSASVLYQAAIWRLGSDLSRHILEEMRPYAKFDRPLYIENMPALFIEGPFIVKDYAFPLYLPSFKPQVRARRMALKVVNGRPVFSGWMDPDDRRPEERIVHLHVLDAFPDRK